jgi:hypothetical protein
MALRAAVEELQDLDHAELSDDELICLLTELDIERERVAAVHARVAAAVDTRRVWAADGSKSCAAWLARRRHRSRTITGSALRLGRTLAAMTLVDDALADGDIAIEHAQELAACRRIDPDHFATDEAVLVDHARRMLWEDFLIVCARWRDAVNPDGADLAAERTRDRRHLIGHRRPDGSLNIQSGLLDPLGAEAFLSELDRIEHELFVTDWADAQTEHGPATTTAQLARTPAQRRADALVEMAHRSRTAPADGRRPEPLVTVYVDYETATGRLCELASGVAITPGQLLPLFTEADIERVVFGPGNRVIELGHRTRLFTGGLRRAIQLRDRHCQWPGCTTPAEDCEIDHALPYEAGGPTTEGNGRCYCPHHHRRRTAGREPPPADPLLEEHRNSVEARLRSLAPPPWRRRVPPPIGPTGRRAA